MTASNENNNNKDKDTVEKITDEIKSIEIKEDDNTTTTTTTTTTNNTIEVKNDTTTTTTTNTITITKLDGTTTTVTNKNTFTMSEATLARINNMPTPDGKPKIIAYTTKADSTSFYDEIDIEDMEFDEEERVFFYPCPCGDRFRITEEEILQGEEIAICPSCSLLLKVIYSPEDFIIEEEEN